MSFRGLMRAICGTAITVTIVAAASAPLISAIVDRSPEGRPCASAFYLALVLSDDSAISSFINSTIIAGVVAGVAGLIGVGLGRAQSRRGVGDRGVLSTLSRSPGVYPPLFAAIGLLGIARLLHLNPDGLWRWPALIWVQLAWSVPRVIEVAAASFARVTTDSVDAARLAGAGRRRAWWTTAWPPARGPVASVIADVFAFTLFEPGAPLLLGLKRTLPSSILASALGHDGMGKAAALGTLGLLLAFVGRAAIRSSAGTTHRAAMLPEFSGSKPGRGGILGSIGLALWLALSFVPLAGLVAVALNLDRSGRVHPDAFIAVLGDRETLVPLLHGLWIGVSATGIAIVLAWGIGPGGHRSSWRDPATWPRVLPPVFLGLGVMLVPGLLDTVAAGVFRDSGPGAKLLHRLADGLDPFIHPWIPLVLAIVMPRIPAMRKALAVATNAKSVDAKDVAKMLGASRLRAWIDSSLPVYATVMSGAIASSIAACAMDSGPSLLLSPTLAARSISPSLRMIAAEPDGLKRAASLAILALLFPIFAWILAGSREHSKSRLSPR